MARWIGIRSRASGFTLLGALLLASAALAASTAFESFERLVARSATDDFARPKATCVVWTEALSTVGPAWSPGSTASVRTSTASSSMASGSFVRFKAST